ncbi:unnamed protein product [Protopolystoma xenopodis]|uniref:Doublecortin domain-containing protein n=1 Tax=Protopolystoma xenopodis TaxID=117903 RepID=A0A3S5AQW1_9PLAT|nr:unnamed protein product [Protopolystoma xenopodis]
MDQELKQAAQLLQTVGISDWLMLLDQLSGCHHLNEWTTRAHGALVKRLYTPEGEAIHEMKDLENGAKVYASHGEAWIDTSGSGTFARLSALPHRLDSTFHMRYTMSLYRNTHTHSHLSGLSSWPELRSGQRNV